MSRMIANPQPVVESQMMKAVKWLRRSLRRGAVFAAAFSTSGCLFGGAVGTPEPLASPLEPYVDRVVLERRLRPDLFNHEVKDLAVFDGRLYIGYGDPNQNTGPVSIISMDMETGEVLIEMQLEEHSIERFRQIGNTLVIPGIDHASMNLDLQGWVYTKRPGQAWEKSGPLPNAIHVLDVIEHGDDWWACGSGYADVQAVKRGDDEAMIWQRRGRDGAWELAFRWADRIEANVARFLAMTPHQRGFYVFGSDRAGLTMTIHPMTLRGDGRNFQWVRLLPDLWAWESFPLGPAGTLLAGVVPTGDAHGRHTAYRVTGDGKVWTLPMLEDEGVRLVDAWPLPGRGTLLLVHDGTLYDPAAHKSTDNTITSRVWFTANFEEVEEWIEKTSDDPWTAVAHDNGRLFLGTRTGRVEIARED